MSIIATRTVGDLAVEMPSAARVFEKVGIDYCCGGGKSLAEACLGAGISLEDITRSLEQTGDAEADTNVSVRWQTEPLSQLTSFIVNKHHVFTREELDRLENLLSKVCSVHSRNHPELLRVQAFFRELKQDLLPHMLKEEQVLFPYIEQMEAARASHTPAPTPFFGTVQNPVRMMMTEHDSAGEILRQLREISENFTAPVDACISYKTLYNALEELERDLHQHIHLENNILFPRAIEMEKDV